MSLADVEAHQRRHGFITPIVRPPEVSELSAPSAVNKLKRARQPNKTETRFGLLLEARKLRGEIPLYAFEAITLHWGDGMKYTPDWVVFSLPILCIEIKGGYKWQKDVVRYKGCSAQWRAQLPDVFAFEMHEEKNGVWQRID